ncbi:MAG TPA: hypothetical protein VKS24_24860 [Bradyrhizobium sp.]|nr:hypothetical protein [Bradyrhizobium sp.]
MATMQQVNEIFQRDMGTPKRSGDWLVWDQFGSRPWMQQIVGEIKSAGIPAFFNARDRLIGIKADAVEAEDANRVRLLTEREQLLARLAEINRLLGE